MCDREACHAAWRNLRMTPLFGCFCPSAQHNKCERLYAFIYNNTCVGESVAVQAPRVASCLVARPPFCCVWRQPTRTPHPYVYIYFYIYTFLNISERNKRTKGSVHSSRDGSRSSATDPFTGPVRTTGRTFNVFLVCFFFFFFSFV